MKSIVFTPTMPALAVITKFTTAALLLVALAACNSGSSSGGGSTKKATTDPLEPTNLVAKGVKQGIDLSWKAAKDATSYTVYYSKIKESLDKTTDSRVDSTTDIKATKISITGLTNGTKYYLRVAAISAAGSHLSGIVEAITILPAPTKVTAKGGDQLVDLSWDVVTGADSYKVYYHTETFDSTTLSKAKSIDKTTDTSISITGLDVGTIYYFRVIAIKAKVSSALSGITSTSTKSTLNTNLKVPKNVIAAARIGAIDLTWDASGDADSYKVYYRDASFDSTTVSGIKSKEGITTTSTSITTGLENGTEYFISIAAIDADVTGESALSTQVSAITKLPAPTKLQATGKDKAIDLSWEAVTGATKYTVYYSKASFDKDTIDSNSVDSTTDITADNISITDLSADTTYYFGVIAINPKISSALSVIKSAITSPAPTLAAPQPKAAASINMLAAVDLSWDSVAGVDGYAIYYAKDKQAIQDAIKSGNFNLPNSGIKSKSTTGASATSITIGDLSVDTTYYFVVVAKHGNTESPASLIKEAKPSYIAELAMGGFHGCVRLDTGRIKCWGQNSKGQLGVDNTTDRYTATSVPNFKAKQLSAGVRHSCAINLEDKLYCWGFNLSLQLGLSDTDLTRIKPTEVTQNNLLGKVSLVTAGFTTTCAVAASKNYCWGEQNFGGLGNGKKLETVKDAQPIAKITGSVKQFALGFNSGCAIDANKALWCWGINNSGQVGNGGKTDQLTPVNPTLKGSGKATMLAGKRSHYCAVDNANKVQCWGSNFEGQLGIDSTADSNSPQYVLASTSTSDHLSGVSKIAAGSEHSCALTTGGKVRCWGESDNGRLGVNGGADRLVANDEMTTISDAINIAAGAGHTCVLLSDKTSVKCWGVNSAGQLGNDTTTDSPTPVKVQGLKDTYQ